MLTFNGMLGSRLSLSVDGKVTGAMFQKMGLSVASNLNIDNSTDRTTSGENSD